jgi:hypothetical protein
VSKNKRRPEREADPLAEMFSGLWTALAAGDVLGAEIETARCLSVLYQLGIDPDKADTVFIGMAKQGGQPEDAALLRLIMLMGSPVVKAQARTALGELTGKGIYPASWVTEAGKAEPVRASLVYDLFGDWEDILVTFRYASGEHTLVARVDLADLPRVRRLALVDGEPPADDGPFSDTEEISLADARAHLEPALRVTESDGFLGPDDAALMPIAKSRLRRLPTGGTTGGTTGERSYTSEDRAALVREFLASPQAAEAVAADEDATRYWAEIATAWSSRIPGHPPLQAGPGTLHALLDDYAPVTYSVTAEQREHMAAAVTAWARWSAAKRGLDEDHMLSMLPQTLGSYAQLYDNDYGDGRRAYLADVATSDADVAGLRDVWNARVVVIPPRDERAEFDDAALAGLDATDAAGRAAFLSSDFAECGLPGGLSREEFIGVARQVAEELWHGEPASTREHAFALLAGDHLDRHDIMHALVKHALSTRS